MNSAARSDWDVRTDDGTVVVELPRQLVLDERAAQRLHESLVDAIFRPGVTEVRWLVAVEHPLSAGLYDVVSEAARTAAEHGAVDWHIVAEHESKAAALERAVTGVETTVDTADRDAQQAV